MTYYGPVPDGWVVTGWAWIAEDGNEYRATTTTMRYLNGTQVWLWVRA